MDLYISNEEIRLREQNLESAMGAVRLDALVGLSWHLRMRDGERALALADEAQRGLNASGTDDPLHRQLFGRILLTRAEVRLTSADLPAAQELSCEAAKVFSGINDLVGLGDALCLQASIASDQGNDLALDECLRQSLQHFLDGGDAIRADVVRVRLISSLAFHDAALAMSRLQTEYPEEATYGAVIQPWLASARANVAGLSSDVSTSIQFDLMAFHTAQDIGLIRIALISLSNAVESFTVLGDLDSALEWMEQGLALARKSSWPSSLGVCLLQMGDVMRLMGRHEEALACLQEAREVMAPLKASRNYELVIFNLGQLALDTGNFEQALEWFDRFDQGVKVLQEPDLLIKALRGQASALYAIGRHLEASEKANSSLVLAQDTGNAEGQIQALCVLAKLHPDLALTLAGASPSGELSEGYLNQALAVSATISGYNVGSDLLSQIAAAYAACGNFKSAYEHITTASEVRQKTRNREASQRVLAMQVKQQLERVQTEADYHRQLSVNLEETASTLETLGIIGREITASLDAQAVFASLHRHVHRLLDATFFAVYLLNEDQTGLDTAFGIEADKPLPTLHIDINHPFSKFAQSVRERSEISIESEPGDVDPNLIPGTLPCLSKLYFPLMAGERLVGAMSVQSPNLHAYGERERAIFRTLCAYGGIALDNARAYSTAQAAQCRADQALLELRTAQSRLLQQNELLERLSITDQLTGLYNRLKLDRTLESERKRHLRYGAPVSLLLIDLDHFKLVNDNFGHIVGDQVLVGVARLLLSNVREVDVVGRWGGEEFLVICRETHADGALSLAEKLRMTVCSHAFASVGMRSISVGVTVFDKDERVAHAIARADSALYRAKVGGRNRVEFDVPDVDKLG